MGPERSYPCDRELSWGASEALGYNAQRIDNRIVVLQGLVVLETRQVKPNIILCRISEKLGLALRMPRVRNKTCRRTGKLRGSLDLSSQEAFTERRVRYDGNPEFAGSLNYSLLVLVVLPWADLDLSSCHGVDLEFPSVSKEVLIKVKWANGSTHSIGPSESVGVALRKPNMAELALLDESLQVLHEVLHRTTRINSSGLKQVELLDRAKGLLDVFNALPEVLRPREKRGDYCDRTSDVLPLSDLRAVWLSRLGVHTPFHREECLLCIIGVLLVEPREHLQI